MQTDADARSDYTQQPCTRSDSTLGKPTAQLYTLCPARFRGNRRFHRIDTNFEVHLSSPCSMPSNQARELASNAGRSCASFKISSPKSVFAHAHHGRVKSDALSHWNDSCMNPVPAVVSRSQRKHWRISLSSIEVSARNMIDMG